MIKKSAVFTISATVSTLALATTSGDSALKLWQIAYTAPTRYADGYTVTGKARTFTGSFQFEQGVLKSLVGKVPVQSLSSGLKARDQSAQDLVFTTQDGRTPDLEFKADTAPCSADGDGYRCEVTGHFKIQDEWQSGPVIVQVNSYKGTPWVHAEGTLYLSKYKFYQTGSAALKVADEVKVVVDLLGE